MSISPNNPSVLKRSAMRAFVVAGVCGLAWHVIAGPMHQKLAAASAQAAALRTEINAYNDSVAALPLSPERTIEQATLRARRLDELSRQTGDASSLYDALASVAKASGVRIERIEPRQTPQGARAGAKSSVESTSFGVEISGDFPAMTEFVDQVGSRIGLTRVTGLRVRPTISTGDAGQVGMLAATVDTTHFRLAQTLDERAATIQDAAAAAKLPAAGTTKGAIK